MRQKMFMLLHKDHPAKVMMGSRRQVEKEDKARMKVMQKNASKPKSKAAPAKSTTEQATKSSMLEQQIKDLQEALEKEKLKESSAVVKKTPMKVAKEKTTTPSRAVAKAKQT